MDKVLSLSQNTNKQTFPKG